MARHIDADKFAEKICDFQAIDEDAANKMIWLLRTFPTADVAPRSEVAREIFEEIEKILVRPEAPTALFYHCSKHSYNELKKKYTEPDAE